jgi:integrase
MVLSTRHTWTDDELSRFEQRWPLGTRERLAFALLLYTGQRAGDIVNMRRSDLSGGMIRVVQQKTGIELSIPLHPALIAAIKATPAKGVTLVGDANGRPIKRATLTLLMRKALSWPGCPAVACRMAYARRSCVAWPKLDPQPRKSPRFPDIAH